MEKKKTKMGRISVLLFLIAIGFSPNAWAQTAFVWTNGTSGVQWYTTVEPNPMDLTVSALNPLTPITGGTSGTVFNTGQTPAYGGLPIIIVAADPNFAGITNATLGPIDFRVGTTLNLPNAVRTIGTVNLNARISPEIVGVGQTITVGAITINGEANLRLKNPGGSFTTGADLAVTNGNLTIDTCSFSVTGASTLTVTAGTLTYNQGNIANTFTTGTGAVTVTDRMIINGTGRVTTNPTPNITFGGVVTVTGRLSVLTTNVSFVQLVSVNSVAVNLTGTDASFTGAASTFNPDLVTDNNTILRFTAAPTGFQANANEVRTVGKLVLAAAQTIAGTLTVADSLRAAAHLTVTGNLTVNGNFVTVGAAVDVIIEANGAVLNLNGPITLGRNIVGHATQTNTLNIGGNGAMPSAGFVTVGVNNLTFSRAGAEMIWTTAIPITGNLRIENGATFITGATLTVTGTTTIEGGVLDLSVAVGAKEFRGTLINNGIVRAKGANTVTLLFASNPLTGTGTFETDAGTNLTFGAAAGVITTNVALPGSIRNLNVLNMYFHTNNALSLAGDLTIASALIAANTGTLQVAGRKLTLLVAPEAALANLKIDARNGSTLELTAPGVLFPATVFQLAGGPPIVNLIDSSTTLIVNGNYTPPAGSFTELKHLTIKGGEFTAAPVTGGNLTIYGNLNIDATAADATFAPTALVGGNYTLTVYGDISVKGNGNDATLNLSGGAATADRFILNTYGMLDLDGDGILTTNTTTNLNILGTNARQFQLPFGSNRAIGSLTLNRPMGARLVFNDAATYTLTLGNITPITAPVIVLDIISGSLDLNGHNLTFANVWNTMKEAPGNYVINTGTSNLGPAIADARGVIYAIAVARVEQINSIGIAGDGIVNAGAARTDAEFRRYPKSVNVPGVGRSTRRYYYVDAQAVITSLTLSYDNKDLVASEFNQKIYIETGAATDAFSNGVQLLGNVTVNPNGNETGSVTVNKFTVNTAGYTVNSTPPDNELVDAAYILALAAPPGIPGVQKIWTNATGDRQWFTAGNWKPVGVPTINDQVVIERSGGIVYISGNNSIATAAQLFLDGDDVELRGSNRTGTGETTNLRVEGNIYVEGNASIRGVILGSRNLLNLIVGEEGATKGVSTTVVAAYPDAEATKGVWFNDVTIHSAFFKPSHGFRTSGNLTLVGSATFDADRDGDDFVFYGPNPTAKSLVVPQSAAAKFGNIVLENTANMTTNASFQLQGEFLFRDGQSAWIATGGTVSANNRAGQKVWNNPVNGNLQLFNAEIGTNAMVSGAAYDPDTDDYWNDVDNHYEPVGNVIFRGTLSKIGSNALIPVEAPYTVGAPTEWAITFQNATGQTEIVRQRGELHFYNLVIADNTKCVTSSSFVIRNYLYVGNNATMDCQGGTVTYWNADNDLMTIESRSDQTLIHNDVVILGDVTTASSFKLRGNFTVFTDADGVPGGDIRSASFTQTAGTVSVINDQPKRIQDRTLNGGAIIFNKLHIADDAVLLVESFNVGTTANTIVVDWTEVDNALANDAGIAQATSFAIKNYGANGTMPTGIEVDALGRFRQNRLGTVNFQTDGFATNLTDAAAKWIINSSVDTNLRFGNVAISGGANNIVRTESSFEIIGGLDGVNDVNFFVQGAGARFNATAGTVTFKSIEDEVLISSIAPATTQFANLRASDIVLNLNDGDEMFVSGDMIADDGATFVMGDPTGIITAKVMLNGKTAPQYLKGNTDQIPAFTFTYLQINKGDLGANYPDNPYADDKGVVYMQRPVEVAEDGTFILTNGILNLGVDTLYMGAVSITRHNGAIDGANGTYVITAGHQTPKLEDAFFEIGKDGAEPMSTLWNLEVRAVHEAVNDLTVNNNMELGADFTLATSTDAGVVEPKLLTVYGNLTRRGGGVLVGGSTTNDGTMSRLVLKGTGTVQPGLSNAFFDGNTAFSITVARAEALAGDLTMEDANLTIATGVNTFALNGRTLILSDATAANPTGVTLVSGSIEADNNSTVNFLTLPIIPANLFTRSEAGTIILGAEEVEMRGDLTINTALTGGNTGGTGPFKLYTGNNVLTFAPGRTLASPGPTRYIIGNLVQTVTNVSKVTFPLGNFGDNNYNPFHIRFQSLGSSRQVLGTVKDIDPTAGRGGDAMRSINATWDITPLGAPLIDNILLEFTWAAANDGITLNNGLQAGRVFAAKWDNGSWFDYRNTINTYAGRNLTAGLNVFPVNGSNALAGTWAVFAAEQPTDISKSEAISTTRNKIVITAIEPMPVKVGGTFNVTIALQDQYGQPITSSVPLPLYINFHNGGVQLDGEGDVDDNIFTNPACSSVVTTQFQANRSEMRIPLSADDLGGLAVGSPIAQLIVAAGGDSARNWTPAISEYFAVLPALPEIRPYDLAFSRITYTSATAKWVNDADAIADGEKVIIIAKADTLLTSDEYPVNGVTYIPNVVYGAGSNIGNATVLYSGPQVANPVLDIAGLLPNTEYFVYAFAYTGEKGNEHYNTGAARRNPNSFKTLTGTHDDITLGGKLFSNELFATSSTIGTNATFSGTIYPAGDVDQFNFMVTSAAPNVRVLLTEVVGDYTVELYDFTGRRIRRSTLNGLSDEALVANNLPAGTYVVKIFAVDGSSWQRPGNEYKLLINTFSSEIFSVTPVK